MRGDVPSDIHSLTDELILARMKVIAVSGWAPGSDQIGRGEVK